MTNKASDFLIALDDGHGMETSGKRTPIFPADSGLKSETGNFMHENEFNRAVVKLLDAELKRIGFKTLLVAPTDYDTSLGERTSKANAAKANLYLSVHANALSGQWGSARGVETLTNGKGESLKAGQIIHKYLVQGTKQVDRGLKDGSWLYVVKNTAMPAVLVECGFMDNLEEAKLLISNEFRKECAVELAKGLCEYFQVAYIEEVQEVKKMTNYNDVKAGAWYESSVKVATELGIMTGDSSGNFRPSDTLTRAEMAAIIAKLHEKGML